MKERKKEMEQPQPKRDRGMNFWHVGFMLDSDCC